MTEGTNECHRCHNKKGIKWKDIPNPLCEECLTFIFDEELFTKGQ